MPEFPKPVTGTFCWVELQAKDPQGAVFAIIKNAVPA
jgi:hypothetical protein